MAVLSGEDGVDHRSLGRTLRRFFYALVGVGLGGLGIGWHGRPTDPVIIEAIRGRSAEHARATIALVDVNRDWFREIYGFSNSRFYVTATITPPGEPPKKLCVAVEPGLAGTALALGPYAPWRCDYPF